MKHKTYHFNGQSHYLNGNSHLRVTRVMNLLQSHLRIFLYVISVLIFSGLNGCSTVTKDGPPSYNVDVSKIPDAKPKVETLSKYGNMPVYRVNGQNYYVMNSSKNFEEEGYASWYGTKFHKHSTSSGEKYNMLAMTAAHRTLPLPTYLQVTNKENGRTVIVKVNDRGPFANDRILDLSYAAAKKLGMIGHGTSYVKIKAIDPVEFNKQEIYTNSFYIVRNNKNSTIQTNDQTQLAANTSANPTTSIEAEKTLSAFKMKQLQYAENKTHESKLLASNQSLRHKTTANVQPKLFASNQSLHHKTMANVQRKLFASNQSLHHKTTANIQPKLFASNQSLHHKTTAYVQVGAFHNKFNAEKLRKQLSPIVASSVKITQQGQAKKIYRVQIGPIKDQVAVARINKQLKSIGLNGKVMFV